jgi:hypothetical protein
VWKAKRVLIMVFGLLLFVSGFVVYTFVLGNIDGLPPLEESKLPGVGPPPPPGRGTEMVPDEKLKIAFGPLCKELQRPLRLWLPEKGVAFAAGQFDIDKTDGRVRLAPFSAAIFHKSKVPGEYPEISTISCDVAILTLDKQVSQYNELNNRKVIGVEMIGRQPGITLRNNRRTPQLSDDIDILITNGPLFWSERDNKIWSEGVVCMTDYQTKPNTVIRGRGLDMLLAKDSSPYRPKNAKPAQNDTGNIEIIKLKSDVQMHFWVDPSSGFLGGTPNQKKPVRPAAAVVAAEPPPEKAHINIRTGGPFVYDLTKETAWFESPPLREDKGFAPDQVAVERRQKIDGGEKVDQLICDRLDLQFRKKANPTSGVNLADQTGDKEIETAKATRRDGNNVTLALDSEGMSAMGSDMFYRAGDSVNGPLTILKGSPLITGKDGHKMQCKELHLFAANRFGEGQRAWSRGPGQIDLLDSKDPKKSTYPTHVIFRNTLTVTKEKEGGQVFDLMVVDGGASFIDDQQHQELHGEKISVWMLQIKESVKKPEASGARQELHRVHAQDKVRARSPEFTVRRADSLTMMFLPRMGRNDSLPDVVVAKPTPDKDPPKNIDAPPPIEEKKPPIPIELEGNKITVAITTLGSKKELQELIAKGNVYVFQAGEKAGEKAIDITGSTLTLNHVDKGDILVVYGDTKSPARLEVGDSIIWGPRVTVDQATNNADVEGAGGMDMPSNKNVDGSDSKSKNTRVRINWNKNMTFDGHIAMFYGGVQAVEKGARSGVLCETLTAYTDKHVSFKEGQKEKQSAKIDKLVFDKNVYIDDTKTDAKDQFVQRAIARGRLMTNFEGGRSSLHGPGEVKLLAMGSADQGIAPPQGVKPNPAKMEWKLTHVKFRETMHANTAEGHKKAIFYGSNEGVEVFHFPTIKIDDKFDPDRPPQDGVYLRCGILEVEEKQAGQRITHILIAKQNVTFRTDKYLAHADILKYDEVNDIVIFEGLNGNTVQMYQVTPEGRTEKTGINSSKVLYNRRTGKMDTEGVKSILN